MERKARAAWWVGFLVAAGALAVGGAAMVWAMVVGLGVWGLNRTVGWAFDISNFVYWIGIGHAGTMISAVLHLFRQRWRTSINRAAEGMTIFAVACAAIYPLVHMGRPWYLFWLAPYPNNRGPLWVNFRSPLLWDFFAILTYLLVSLVFWYVGMIPDLATLRDRATGRWQRALYGFFALGWNGSARDWNATLAVSLAVQAWTSAVDRPLRVGAQPCNYWSAWFPVTIMLTMLVAAFTDVGALSLRARLWPGRRAPVLPGVTDDRFALALVESDATVKLSDLARLLHECGATGVTEGDDLR